MQSILSEALGLRTTNSAQAQAQLKAERPVGMRSRKIVFVLNVERTLNCVRHFRMHKHQDPEPHIVQGALSFCDFALKSGAAVESPARTSWEMR
jgi:hypothetical protein